MQDNYPETLGKTLIINAPSIFKMIWGLVKPMLDVRTQAKIEVGGPGGKSFKLAALRSHTLGYRTRKDQLLP